MTTEGAREVRPDGSRERGVSLLLPVVAVEDVEEEVVEVEVEEASLICPGRTRRFCAVSTAGGVR